MNHPLQQTEIKKDKILVVDDEESLRMLLESVLQEAGYITENAENGLEAVSVAQSFLPDLIVLDVYMPIMNGFQAATEIRKIRALSKVPIMFLTGATTPESLRIGFESGGDEYLYKPINAEELLIRVNALLRMHHAEEDAEKLSRNYQYLLTQDFLNYSTAVKVPLLMLAEETAGALNEHQKEIINIAVKALDEHIQMLHESALISKIDPKNIFIKKAPFNIIKVIERSISHFENLITQKQLVVNKNYTDEIIVDLDQENIAQAFQLLLSHALMSTPEGGNISISINKINEDSQTNLSMIVQDGGEPLSEEELNLIVDRYEQARLNIVLINKNLSLTFCKMIIDAHGGRFWAENADNYGNNYKCLIPM